jgi:hypothetical protein
MLSQEESAQIREAEIVRLEASRELEARKPPPSRRERLWATLNSSFVLWFLSSVVIAGVSTSFAAYQGSRDKRLAETERERRLDVEISNRIYSALKGLSFDKQRVEEGEPFSRALAYDNALNYLDNSWIATGRPDFSIFPEFKSRTFRSLVVELTAGVDPSSQAPLTGVLNNYEPMMDLATPIAKKPEVLDKPQALAALVSLEDLLHRIAQPRWRSLVDILNHH